MLLPLAVGIKELLTSDWPQSRTRVEEGTALPELSWLTLTDFVVDGRVPKDCWAEEEHRGTSAKLSQSIQYTDT